MIPDRRTFESAYGGQVRLEADCDQTQAEIRLNDRACSRQPKGWT